MGTTFLCVASYFKGEKFMIGCKEAGCTVYLVTSKKHEDKAWPREHIDEIFYVQQDDNDNWKMDDVIAGLAYTMRNKRIDRIVALDDFDVEKAALLRETFRSPGMGQTTARYFRDKLAMRMKAQEEGVPVPAFSSLFNDEQVNHFIKTVPAPWVIKPRGEASATGIRKIHSGDQLWEVIHQLGGQRHNYLVEQFKPGDVYHVDALTFGGKQVFVCVSKYVNTPMEVAHGGGIFRSYTIPHNTKEEKDFIKINADVMNAFGMQYSASHTEFIKCHEDGKIYFLETASRVGGANLSDMIEMASGINLWYEWAKLEAAVANGKQYAVPKAKKDYAGIIISLAREKHPNTTEFTETEIVWRLHLDNHIGFIVKSNSTERILALLDNYAQRIQRDYHASVPVPLRPRTS
ncbi:MAG: ATP-grasp domain-containing protein [Saprospiraceae bacterium]|nr:ATP-grasp domain-containing protein [Saprospiraceae bacterium]